MRVNRQTTLRLSSLFAEKCVILLVALSCMTPLESASSAMQNECKSSDGEGAIVIFGASYAQNWPIKTIAGYPTINRGINGNQSFEMRARFTADVLDSRPEAVLIWGFINDLFRSTPETLEQAKKRIKSSYMEMIEDGQRHGIYVVVATEVTIREPLGFMNWVGGIVGSLRGKESYQAKINDQVSEVNLWIKEFASAKQVPLLDFQQILSDEGGRRKEEYATSDGSHLTSAAYDALSRYTSRMITSLCEPV